MVVGSLVCMLVRVFLFIGFIVIVIVFCVFGCYVGIEWEVSKRRVGYSLKLLFFFILGRGLCLGG